LFRNRWFWRRLGLDGDEGLRERVQRRHVEKVIGGQILENLVEWDPDLGAGDRVNSGFRGLGQRHDEVLDGDLDVAACELGIDGGKG